MCGQAKWLGLLANLDLAKVPYCDCCKVKSVPMQAHCHLRIVRVVNTIWCGYQKVRFDNYNGRRSASCIRIPGTDYDYVSVLVGILASD